VPIFFRAGCSLWQSTTPVCPCAAATPNVSRSMMSHRQTWRLSQDAGKNSGECSVCHAVRQLHLKDGTVHQHGPRDNRCPGSGKPPAILHVPPPQHSSSATATGLQPSSPDTLSQSQSLFTQTQQQLTTQQPHQRTTVDHPDLPGNIIKHIPRSARLHCAVQLTKAIKIVITQPDDPAAWSSLLDYDKLLLLAPPRSGRKHNVANVLKKRTMDAVCLRVPGLPTSLQDKVLLHVSTKD